MAVRKDSTAKAERAKLDNDALIVVDDVVGKELDAWLAAAIERARASRDEKIPRILKWRKTLSGIRPTPPVRTSASNLSVPLTTWVRTAVRARLQQGVFESSPILTVKNLRPVGGEHAESDATVSNALSRLLTSEIMNPRGLNGESTINRAIAEDADFGMSAWKVVPHPDKLCKYRPITVDGEPVLKARKGRVAWEFVSMLDLLWVDGYGDNANAMPFIGHEFDRTWSEIKNFADSDYYDSDVVDEVEAFYKTGANLNDTPAQLRDHRIAEIYLDYDIDNDGYLESIVIDWHLAARKRLRCTWNPFSEGHRPIVLINFDMPADLTSACGQGLCEKLEGPQDEVDAVHNIAIEAGKRGTSHVIVLKEGSRAEEEFGGDDEIIPGDVIVTGTPKEDIQSVALGDPNAALAALQIEEHTRLYVTRMFGLDEARLGNVEAGKRVSAAVGMSTMREGRVIIKAGLLSVGRAMVESIYLTLDIWKRRMPRETLASVLTSQEVEALYNSVFSLSDESIRATYEITVTAEDAATSQEAKKSELLAINQFLFGVYDRMERYILTLANPQLPPAARRPLELLITRIERGIVALLNTLDSIANPQELLVEVGEMVRLLETSAPGATPPMAPTPSTEDTDRIQSAMREDLGAGVV